MESKCLSCGNTNVGHVPVSGPGAFTCPRCGGRVGFVEGSSSSRGSGTWSAQDSEPYRDNSSGVFLKVLGVIVGVLLVALICGRACGSVL